MKISVVIPTFNGAIFLKQAIHSVVNQNFIDFELIISDDGSTDDSISIIRSFQDPRIFLFQRNEDQKGIFLNLNYAISKSSGEYIQILCQDDVLEQDFLTKQINSFANDSNIGMVFSNVKVLNEKSEIFELDQETYRFRESYLMIFPKVKSLDYFTVYGCMPGNLSPVMLKRSAYEKIGPFNNNFPYAGDFEYWIRIGFEYDIAYNRHSYVFLRRHDGQASKTLIKKNYNLIKEIGEIYRVLSKKAFDSKREKEVIFHLNQSYGALFLKTIINHVLNNNFSKLYESIVFLNHHPFSLVYSIYFLFERYIFKNKSIRLIKYL